MYHFIMNPNASSGKGLKIWKQVEKILKEEQVEYEQHVLKSAKEATEFVRKMTAYENFQGDGAKDCHIVVLGGDGTLHAVLNGIEDFEHTILSCIRTGSGNDFARNVGVTKNVSKAIKHLLNEPEQMCLDYGVAAYETDKGPKSRRFIISTGVGYDADICEEVGRSGLKKKLNKINLGKLVYVMIGIKQVFTRINSGATIYMDGEKFEVPAMFFVVGMIHEFEGGGVPFCPKADPTDGMLDVCLVQGMPRWKLLLAIVMVYMRKHFWFKKITAHRCKKIVMEPNEPQWFHMDGETSCKISRMEMECKSGLRFYK